MREYETLKVIGEVKGQEKKKGRERSKREREKERTISRDLLHILIQPNAPCVREIDRITKEIR